MFKNVKYFTIRFGVCCVFFEDECGTTIDKNQTYIRNPGFPSEYSEGTSSCSYTIKKCDDGNTIV